MATMTITKTSLQDRVLQNAHRRHEILRTIQETEYAARSLPLKSSEINTLQHQVAIVEKQLSQLQNTEIQEQQKLESIHASHVHKAFHKKSTWHAREAEEERRLDTIQQKEHNEEKQRDQLNNKLQGLQSEKSAVEADVARHNQASRSLEQLYETIFAGPTPDLPEAEVKRNAVQDAQAQVNQVQSWLQTETNAMEALNASAQCLNGAMQQLQSSNTMATVDIFAGGDLVDLLERQKLAQAQGLLNQCISSLNQARSLQPQIPPLSDVFIDQGHILSNVVFNCAITDFMQAQRIQNTVQQCSMAVNQLQQSVTQQQMRVQNAQSSFASTGQQLADCQNDLWNCRKSYMDNILQKKTLL